MPNDPFVERDFSVTIITKKVNMADINVPTSLRLHEAAAHFDGISRSNLSSQICDDLAVDSDSTGKDKLLHAAAGAEAGRSKEAIQTHR